ncbi:serine O-acetyltransferase [Buchnera aphidicola]|nr:serine acetyltransferase [Buchnera aphidicola]
MSSKEVEIIWHQIISEVEILMDQEPELAGFYHAYILQHDSFDMALSYILSNQLSNKVMSTVFVRDIINKVYIACRKIVAYAIQDIKALFNHGLVHCYSFSLLHSKGFHALQAYRISNFLWCEEKKSLALYFQNRISCLFSVDIHPASMIGSGIVLDNAIGITIGQTSAIKDSVSVLSQSLALLGSAFKISSVQCPKINEGVIIGANVAILGNVVIGEKTKIQACTVVLQSVPPNSIVTSVLAKIVSFKNINE